MLQQTVTLELISKIKYFVPVFPSISNAITYTQDIFKMFIFWNFSHRSSLNNELQLRKENTFSNILDWFSSVKIKISFCWSLFKTSKLKPLECFNSFWRKNERFKTFSPRRFENFNFDMNEHSQSSLNFEDFFSSFTFKSLLKSYYETNFVWSAFKLFSKRPNMNTILKWTITTIYSSQYHNFAFQLLFDISSSVP